MVGAPTLAMDRSPTMAACSVPRTTLRHTPRARSPAASEHPNHCLHERVRSAASHGLRESQAELKSMACPAAHADAASVANSCRLDPSPQ